MPYVLLGLALAGVPLVANALRPLRWEPLSVPSFLAGWLTGELALQHLVWQAALTIALGLLGAFDGWPGWLGLGVAVVDWIGLGVLAAAGWRTGTVVTDALRADMPHADATGGPWFRWWRLALAVPLRGRTVERIKGVDYWGDGVRRHRLDVLRSRRAAARDAPVLVQVHGGAWLMGDKREQGLPLICELVSRGWVCVAINYRLGPRATWPDEIVDCKRAIAWVKEHIAGYGGDPSRVVVTGGSAGGQLSALVALTANDPEWQPTFEAADTSVAACVPFYGVFDMTGSLGWPERHGRGFVRMLERFVIKADLARHRKMFERASPTLRVHPDAPPFFVLHGANDTLVPVEVARRFVAALREGSRSQVLYAELPLAQHAFDVLVSPRSAKAVVGVATFLESITRRGTRRD